MTDETTTPILVNSSALNGQLAVFARDVLKVAGGVLVTKGIVTASLLDQSIGIAIAAAPMVYSQLKTWWTHHKLLTLAESPRVPNDLARVKQ